MAKLKEKEFKTFKRKVDEDKQQHYHLIRSVNTPAQVIAAYNGRFYDGDSWDFYGDPESSVGDGSGDLHNKNSNAYEDIDTMVENYLFIAINTILPGLFFQSPRIIIRTEIEELQFQASVLTALANKYFTKEMKKEIQLCIIDAFLPWGYAVMKNGYNSRSMKVPKSSMFTGTKGKSKDAEDDMEGDVEFISFEKPLTIRQSPRRTYLDSTKPFGKGNRITFEYRRTLKEIIDSNLYDISQNFIDYFRGKTQNGEDDSATLTLFEHWYMKGNKAWKVAYVEEWDEELAHVKTKYKRLPSSQLRFNEMGDVLYTISHGTQALKAQKELNFLNELWKQHLDNMRNQILAHEGSLTESGQETLRNNDIAGIVFTQGKITGGEVQPIQGATVDPQLFANINTVRSYLNLIMSTTGVKAGEEAEKLATSEKQKMFGDVLRGSGMQDAIRDFIEDIIKQLIENILTFGNLETTVKLVGTGLINPFTGIPIESGSELAIGGDGGFGINEIISGDIDSDFLFDIDIASAQKPDFPVIRKQIAEGIAVAQGLQMQLAAEGKKLNASKAIELYFGTFDQVPEAKNLVIDMSDEDKQNMLAQQVAEAGGEGVPDETQMAAGAETVPTGTEGLV